jgi:hypothetical protein
MHVVAGLTALVVVAAGAAAAAPALAPADTAAAFKAAGFMRRAGEWVRCDDTQTASRQSGALEVADLNDDGAPEAWVRESSLFCYGATAEAFVLLTKRGSTWTVLLDEVGVPMPRPTRTRGWPDIEVGGPGLGAMPVYRFDGARYRRTAGARP